VIIFFSCVSCVFPTEYEHVDTLLVHECHGQGLGSHRTAGASYLSRSCGYSLPHLQSDPLPSMIVLLMIASTFLCLLCVFLSMSDVFSIDLSVPCRSLVVVCICVVGRCLYLCRCSSTCLSSYLTIAVRLPLCMHVSLSLCLHDCLDGSLSLCLSLSLSVSVSCLSLG
jgi:hypothetical protein